MDTLSVESGERIVELERRLALARDQLLAEVVYSVEKCAEFADRQARMGAEIAALQRQRGVYWRTRSSVGRVLRRLGFIPRRRGNVFRTVAVREKLQ